MAKVLVVDDETDIRMLHRLILQSAGHEVTEAPDGARALDLVRRSRPDVVVTDFIMPVMTGGEFIAALRADPSTAPIPVIIVSASIGQSTKTGADIVFHKPAPFDQLLHAVAESISASKAGS